MHLFMSPILLLIITGYPTVKGQSLNENDLREICDVSFIHLHIYIDTYAKLPCTCCSVYICILYVGTYKKCMSL